MHKSRLMGNVRQAFVVVGAVLGVAVVSAGTASADGPVELKSRLGDVCLDAPSGSWYTPVVINPAMGRTFSAGISPLASSRAWPFQGIA
ncbi:MAG: hypothetical protein QOH91_3630 [Mycobacterium sp.]|nr:hypothetical protein [Mycobacterium sp.]